ncbi:MAG: CIA30 family protein [Acidobacteria bacterium]|nr:CIA30 family protein [Acidobacteriota bacterium]
MRAQQERAKTEPMLVDDFENAVEGMTSRLGTKWDFFTDKSRGGTSTVQGTIAQDGAEKSKKSFQLSGRVTTDFQYGYAGASLSLNPERKDKDLTGYSAIRFYARGDGGRYRVELWSSAIKGGDHYGKDFIATRDWMLVEIPFSQLSQIGFGMAAPWTGTDVHSLGFMTASQPREKYLLQIDEIMFVNRGVVDTEPPRAGKLVIEPTIYISWDNQQCHAELGRFWVPENRSGKSSRLVQLSFVRLPSTATKPEPPIVYLVGGPGASGIFLGQHPIFLRLREIADVILLDQRGAGSSTPNLGCPAYKPPVDLLESADKAQQIIGSAIRECANHLRAQGIDLSAYNSNASADDIEELRRALGLDKLSLLGVSYGVELALTVIRRHGDRLHRVVLDGTRGPDNALNTLPSTVDWQLKRISHRAGSDPVARQLVPNLESSIRQLLDEIDRKQVPVTVTDRQTGRKVEIRVGKFALQAVIRSLLGNGSRLPAMVYTINRGDYSLLTRQVEQINNEIRLSGMALAVDCASSASTHRMERFKQEAERAMLLNVNLDDTNPEFCKHLGNPDLGWDFRSRVWSTLPTLFLSGSEDSATPPFYAEEVRWGFPNSVHLVIENAGHVTHTQPVVHSTVIDFFKGLDVRGRVLSVESPRFLTVEEAKR